MRKPIDQPTRRCLIREWHASGESARTYAIRQGIPLSTFYEWSRRVSPLPAARPTRRLRARTPGGVRKPIDSATRRRLIQEWRASGESGRAYANRQGVPLSTFYEWSRRFSVSEESAFTELAVVKNEPQALASGARMQLEVDGIIVSVGRATDLELLAQVLEVLRAC